MNILATLVYLQKDGKILMLKGNKKGHFKKGIWNGLGGKIEAGESPEECAIREIKEESGLNINKLIFSGILIFPEQDTNKNSWYVFVYKCNDFNGKLRESKEGELSWIKKSELFDLNMSEGDYIFLPWIQEGKLFSAKFIYKEGKLLSHNRVFYS